MSQIFHRGYFSLRLDDLEIFLKDKLPGGSSRGEIYSYILKSIKEQIIFSDIHNINHVIGNFRDVIFLKKNKLFLKKKNEIISNIITSAKIEPDFPPFVFDEAFLLHKETANIRNFIMSPTTEGYRMLNIFARAFIFENVFPQPNKIQNDNIIKLVETVEKGNYLTSQDILTRKQDRELRLYRKFEGFLFHKIIPEFHTKHHAIRKDVTNLDGLRFHDGDLQRGWRNVSILNKDDVYEIVEIMYDYLVETSTSSVSLSVMTEEQLSKLEWVFPKSFPLKYKFIKIVDIEGNFVKYKRLTLEKHTKDKKKKCKGQDCLTLNFKAELDEYLFPFFKEIDNLLRIKTQSEVKDILKKFTNEDVVFTENESFRKQIKEAIKQKFNDVRKDTKCELLFELQQTLFKD